MRLIVLIAASAGGIGPLRQIVAAIPVPCEASVFVVQHIGANVSRLPGVLSATGLPAMHAHDNPPIEAGHIYVAPSDHHMLLELGRIRLNRGPKVHYTRPAADPLFLSAAEVYGERVIGLSSVEVAATALLVCGRSQSMAALPSFSTQSPLGQTACLAHSSLRTLPPC
jgi:two-component system chemotaxis response regulator CheB